MIDGEESLGADGLLLHLVLVESLLENRQERDALNECYACEKTWNHILHSDGVPCPAIDLLLGRCQLRLGMWCVCV